MAKKKKHALKNLGWLNTNLDIDWDNMTEDEINQYISYEQSIPMNMPKNKMGRQQI